MELKEQIEIFEKLDFLANQAVEGFITGLHKSPFHGFSVEFAEHRQYNDGESTKHIDWKLYARSDKYFVKKYEEETNLRCRIIIDNSSSMYFPKMHHADFNTPNKIYHSIFCSLALMKLFKKQRDAVGLSVFSDKLSLHTNEKTTTKHHQLLYSELKSLFANNSLKTTTSAVQSLHEIADSIAPRSLVVLFSDLLDNSSESDHLMSALQHLRFNKHEVVVFHLMDKEKEFDFDFENRPYKFIDMESGEEMKLSPKNLKKEYQKFKLAQLKEWKQNCAQFKIDFVDVDINKDIDKVLMTYLHKRKQLVR
jgi:uncharacterized protein (DUF58 family)